MKDTPGSDKHLAGRNIVSIFLLFLLGACLDSKNYLHCIYIPTSLLGVDLDSKKDL